jgi:hypothetical protein
MVREIKGQSPRRQGEEEIAEVNSSGETLLIIACNSSHD